MYRNGLFHLTAATLIALTSCLSAEETLPELEASVNSISEQGCPQSIPSQSIPVSEELSFAPPAHVLIFVNNANPISGDGSFSNPYNTLTGAQSASAPGDVIFVFAGDGTSHGMDTGIVLKDNQSLIGSGSPLITNPYGNAVELANNNQVSGLHIDSAGGWGIYASGIAKASLTNNLITNSLALGGIGIFDCSEEIQIENSTVLTGGGTSMGIQIESHGATTTSAQVKANIISGFYEGIVIFAFEDSSISSHVTLNDVSQTISAGIDIDAFDQSNSKTIIDKNNVHDHAENGIITFTGTTSVTSPSAALLRSVIENNIIANCGHEGLAVATGNSGQQVAVVAGNAMIGNGGKAGMIVETSSTAFPGDVICLRLKRNTSDTGFFLRNFEGDAFNLEPPAGNIGTLTNSGAITYVAPGYCN